MSNSRARFATVFVVLLAVLSACGGGGGSSSPPPPPPPAATMTPLQAILSETSGAAVSAAALEVWSNGDLKLTVIADPLWVSEVTSVPLRVGAIGVPGGSILVDFKAGGGAFEVGSLSLTRLMTVSAATASAIANAPGNYHLALIRSGPATDFARGQLSAFAPVQVHARLDDGAQVPTARGLLTALGSFAGSVSWVLATEGMPVSGIDGIALEEDGDPLPPLALDIASATQQQAHQTASRTEFVPLSRLLRILARPDAFTLEVISVGASPPKLAGPLSDGPLDVVGRVRAAEGSLGSLKGGGVAVHFPTYSQALAVVAVPGGAGPTLDGLSAFEVREGTSAQPGPLLFDVLGSSGFTKQPDKLSGQGTVPVDQELVTRMVLDPASFHARLATPGGAQVVASDLAASPPRLFAELGDTGTPHEGKPGAAAVDVWVTSSGTLHFQIESANPQVDPATLTGAVAHPVGTTPTAAEKYDLLETQPSSQVEDGNLRSGDATVPRHDVARLLADPAAVALSLTTDSEPDGVARGGFRDALLCPTKYIPPFEGVWNASAGGTLNMSGGSNSCGSFTGSGSINGVSVSMKGQYLGSQVDVEVKSPTETIQYSGTLTSSMDITTSETVTTIPQQILASHGTVHGKFGRLWLGGAEYTLVFTTYPSPSLGADPLAGFLTCHGVKIPFTGTESGGGLNLTLDLVGVDLTPCPALSVAWQGLTQAPLSGSLTTGVGQLSLGAPVNKVFDRTNR